MKENKPLGTIGSILLVNSFNHDDIILMNSDVLTNINIANFYKYYKESGADMAVAVTTYHVKVPFAVIQTNENQQVLSLKEKPDYTYLSNAGIYIIKTKLLSLVPEDTYFDITDFMNKIIELNYKLFTFKINGYWLDIGSHEDYNKAQEDIKNITL